MCVAVFQEFMPLKSKRKVQLQDSLEKVREAKRKCDCSGSLSQEALIEVQSECDEPSLTELALMTKEELNMDDEEVDPSFNLESSIKSETDHVIDQFCEEWVYQLDTDDKCLLEFSIPYSCQSCWMWARQRLLS